MKPEALEEACAVCAVPATQKCGACKLVFYCNKEHQKKHWKLHSKRCKAFKLVENESLGRHYVATRDIELGELIIREDRPLVQAPQQDTLTVCLECGSPLEAKTQGIHGCESCGWPLCSKCSDHTGPECRFTRKYRTTKVSITGFGLTHPTYKCIGPVRALSLKQDDPEAYAKFTSLASKCELTSEEADLRECREVAKFVRRFFDKLGDEYSDDEIARAIGILQINGHEIPMTEPPSIVVYNATSFINHSCRANCSKTFMSSAGVLIRALLPIKKGEQITICYTDPLWGTQNRRHHLQRTKYFSCTCERCSDPTEFGSMFNALKCASPECPGYALPRSFLVDEVYECQDCGQKLNADEVHEEIGRDLASLEKGSLEACRAFIKRHQAKLHENHFYMTDVKVVLAQMIGQTEKGLTALDDDTLCEKIILAKKLSELLEVIVPAENRVRGMILFELHGAMAEFGRRHERDHLFNILEETRKVLVQSYNLLKYEPEMLPEGKIAKTAGQNIQDLEVVLRKLLENLNRPMM